MEEKDYKLIINSILSLIDEGVYIVDSQGEGLFYNKAMAKIEKVQVGDVLGKSFQHAFPGVELKDSTMYKALNKGIATRNQEQTYTNLYGKEITTVNSTLPIKDGEKIVAAVEVAKDITYMKSMRDKILDLTDIKEKSSKTKGGKTIAHYTFADLIGDSPSFAHLISKAKRAAQSNATVFINGETGTGKELLSQSIHYESARANKPFLAQNCAALPETLLEGILFGTAKGGFTGAVDRAGLFEQANGGTLLLDEISAMPYDLQSKLLRVLQEDYIRRVGGKQDIPVDVRIIATVNEDPMELMAEGRLRKDLYYRLNVVSLNIPPLRERLEDIPLLVEQFLEKYNQRFDKALWMASDKAIERLQKYDYPGNVRELENIVAQAVALAGGEHVLTEKHLSLPDLKKQAHKEAAKWDGTLALDQYLENTEKEIIRDAIIRTGGNVTKAAKLLQIKRQTLQHKLKKFHLEK